jgi:hypothetical protein
MAHYAKVLDGNVLNVIKAEPEFFETFIDDSPGDWIQTSYNTRGGVHYDPATGEESADQTQAIRYNFAVTGGKYNAQDDAFYDNQPYPSWTLNKTSYEWEAPSQKPQSPNGEKWGWDEDSQTWVADPDFSYSAE